MRKFWLGLMVLAIVVAWLPAQGREVVKEDWNWAAAMFKVAKKGKGSNNEGVVLTLGDSICYANQSTRWGRMCGKGGTKEDQEILKWTHAGKRDDTDGWYLASVDRPAGRSETAASGIRTDQYIRGGFRCLPSLQKILEKYKPQIVFILLGTTDSSSGRKPEDVVKDMTTIVETVIKNGTIPVVQMVAPMKNDTKHENVKKYNELYLKMAKEKKIPIVDLYGEFLKRAPDGKWKTQLLSGDGIHFTHKLSGGPPTEENLANCGYLLRCWLSVQKIKEIKKQVIDKLK